MKRALLYLSIIPILLVALAWVVWESRIDPSEADTAPRLSVQVCWPTAWGSRPTAVIWTASEEVLRPAPGSMITPPGAYDHSRFIFDQPVNVNWNYGSYIQAVYGMDTPQSVTVVTAMWSDTSGGYRYVGQATVGKSGFVSISADLCAAAAPAPAPEPKYHPVAVAPGHPVKPWQPAWVPQGPPPVQSLNVSHWLKYNKMNMGRQYIYFTVRDQSGRPLPGARADIVVHFPWGDRRYGYGPSDGNGQMFIWFDVGSISGGYKVPIDVVTTYDGITCYSHTDFWVP